MTKDEQSASQIQLQKRNDHLPDFMKMDSFDAIQVFNDQFKEKLVYEIETYDPKTKTKKIKHELTFIGIKQLILEQAKQKGEAMLILKEECNRIKIDESDPKQDVWHATVVLKNSKTNQETLGVSEADVFPLKNWKKFDDNGKQVWENNKPVTVYERRYDQFGRTAAVSKAIRNAERQQLPEMAIQLFVEAALLDPNKVQKTNHLEVDGTQKTKCDCPLGIRDWDYENHLCRQCGLPMPEESKTAPHACKCDAATKEANAAKNGKCPRCEGSRI